MMRAFTQSLREWEPLAPLTGQIDQMKGGAHIIGCSDSAKPNVIYATGDRSYSKIIVTFREQKAKELMEDYHFYDRDAIYYPAKDLLFYQADVRGSLLVEERMKAFAALREQETCTIFTTFDGLMDQLPAKEGLYEFVRVFHTGDTVEPDKLKEELVKMGYERNFQVEQKGEFAARGGIVDIFPLTMENPVRIEFWDDTIDSIRCFDAESQRSIENMQQVEIYPSREFAENGCVSLLSYFDPAKTVVYIDEPVRTFEKGRATRKEFAESMKYRLEKGMMRADEIPQLFSEEEICAKLSRYKVIALSALDETAVTEIDLEQIIRLTGRTVNTYNSSFELLVKDLLYYKQTGYRIVLMSGSRTRAKRLAGELLEKGVNSFYTEDYDREVQPGEVMTVYGKLHRGFDLPQLSYAVICESDIFGQEKKKKRKKSAYEGEKIFSFQDLKVGDYVVHEKHGLGIYRGIEKVEVDRVVKDYVKIEYAKGGSLFVLATQLDALQKYANADAKKPKLSVIGGQEWIRTRNRVKSAVAEVAKELVELYAVRQEKEGYVYGPDTVWQAEFEEMFPFEETDDQLQAIEAVKHDMESTKIMDRLVCGDVGYGKTEIAIRAAFKAAQESKQVAYLVPTTILAEQHYKTFCERMKDFPVNIELLCRFRTPAQQKKSIERLKNGTAEIVIGTHRLLSDDVVFHDLGLLIIDEEQRFGVTHKEKIKQLKKNIDVLTLTATPIPRTLHMSLIGIRDMSVLEEAPMDRQPIQTFVMEYDEELVREAISRELSRDGQVFYVFNRINRIEDITARLAALVPEATVAYAHGQMRETQLEKIMTNFINGEIDVLVSTTIIETGLDISNVNTIIIHDADNMGLSQLYQLRGRVGRSNRTAYAFLMYRRNKMLKETAEKRLEAIAKYTELGSGIRIAMRDLEIRGAGNLLGEQQSGHMEAVGYDLYCKMLNEAVKELKGESTGEQYETAIDINIDAYIPVSYIANEFQKLEIYKRIASIESTEECAQMEDELYDRFGEPPRAVTNLLKIALLKCQAHALYITDISQKQDILKVTLYEKAQLDVAKIPQLVQKNAKRLNFMMDAPPYFEWKMQPPRGKANAKIQVVEQMEELLNELGALKKD